MKKKTYKQKTEFCFWNKIKEKKTRRMLIQPKNYKILYALTQNGNKIGIKIKMENTHSS